MVKLMGCVCIILTGGFIGGELSSRLNRRLRNMRNIRLMLEDIRIMIAGEFMPTKDIIGRLGADEKYSDLDFLKTENDIDLNIQLSENVKSSCLDIPDDIRKKLADYLLRLGTTDSDGQTALIDMLITEYDSELKDLSEYTSKMSPLYFKLGILGGLMAAVAVI